MTMSLFIVGTHLKAHEVKDITFNKMTISSHACCMQNGHIFFVWNPGFSKPYLEIYSSDTLQHIQTIKGVGGATKIGNISCRDGNKIHLIDSSKRGARKIVVIEVNEWFFLLI